MVGLMVPVMGLDIGTCYAASFDGADGKPDFAHVQDRMPVDDDFGPLFGRFAAWLRDLIAIQSAAGLKPRAIGCEAPWIAYNAGEDDTPTPLKIAEMLLGMTGVAATVATAHGLRLRKCHIQKVRKTFTGSGNAKKADVRARCVHLNWRIRNGHEADSGAVYAFLKMEHDRSFVLPPPGVLFANVRVTA